MTATLASFPRKRGPSIDAAKMGPRFRGDDGTGTWSRHLTVLGAIAAVLLALFRHDAADLAHLWWTSTTFGHCLFIGPVIGWLVPGARGGN